MLEKKSPEMESVRELLAEHIGILELQKKFYIKLLNAKTIPNVLNPLDVWNENQVIVEIKELDTVINSLKKGLIKMELIDLGYSQQVDTVH